MRSVDWSLCILNALRLCNGCIVARDIDFILFPLRKGLRELHNIYRCYKCFLMHAVLEKTEDDILRTFKKFKADRKVNFGAVLIVEKGLKGIRHLILNW